MSGFVGGHGSANTTETVCVHFLTVTVPWLYPDRTPPKLTQNVVFLLTTALPVYQSTIRSLTIVFTISGVHNNNVQGVDTHLLFRFLHCQKIGFKIKKNLYGFKVKIPWKLDPQSLYNYGTTTKYRNTVKILDQKNNYLRFYPTFKNILSQNSSIRYYACLRHTVIQIEPYNSVR